YERYQLAFTPGLLTNILVATAKLPAIDVPQVLGLEAGYRDLDGDGNWWVPSGQVRYAPTGIADELSFATEHFFLPQRVVDPFGAETLVRHDAHDLLPLEVEDALGNRTTCGEREPANSIASGNDYRTLQPTLVTDSNGNRTAIAIDALGLVVGTAVM